MDWSPRIVARGRPRGWHRPIAMGMGYPAASILAPSAPVITTLTPSNGAIGAAVTIAGANFGGTQGGSTVTVNGVSASVTSWSASSIGITIPTTTTGPVSVVVGGQPSNGVTFTVTAAETYHFIVEVGGTDSSGTPGTLLQPFGSVKYAMERARAALTGTGKTIGVRGGYHPGFCEEPDARGTSWTNKIRITNYNGEPAWMRPSGGVANQHLVSLTVGNQQYLEFDGINFDGSLMTSEESTFRCDDYTGGGAHHIRVLNAELYGNPGLYTHGVIPPAPLAFAIHNTADAVGDYRFSNLVIHHCGTLNYAGYGFYASVPDLIIENCDIYDVGTQAITLYHGGGSGTGNAIIRNNYIHDINRDITFGVAGIQAYGGNIRNAQIYNNVIANLSHANGAKGITIGGSTYGHTIAHNTFYNLSTNMISIEPDAGAGGSIVNNAGWTSGGSALVNSAGWPTSTNDLASGGANPGFVNAGAGNFHLTSGSRLRGAATPSGYTSDKDGQPRPTGSAWDIGAYQYVP